MGNTACCAAKDSELDKKATTGSDELRSAEAVPVSDGMGLVSKGKPGEKRAAINPPEVGEVGTYTVTLDKAKGGKLGLDVDYMAERNVLPIMSLTGGLAAAWNETAPPNARLRKGDSIIEVNGNRNDVATMLDKCKNEQVLNLVLAKALSYDHLLADLQSLVEKMNCGPILVRLSWHDAGVFMQGKGGCPNAAMRFVDGGEGTWAANAGLTTVALELLGPITRKYVPDLISNADLWALAANVAIKAMGGPAIVTRFGRTDAKNAREGCQTNDGRLPDADKGADHLRAIFHPKGFDDRAIVALSGAHTVGKCHIERSGFDGQWTENHLKFDNSYFKELLEKTYTDETTAKGMPQCRHAPSNTMMLKTDLALLADPVFKTHVEEYARDQALFFTDFTKAWVKLQENGCEFLLRDVL
mmetsp:Transcript_5026/g.14801  ORF Transcript_5026/g.14801 Transcript_5026/m.14801 type:complete len:414 (+) Transcript_5026:72-1313(+)|eukprot:CAMPEP_0176053768 /NCGR_PEP_ID=MMETSP0120_2-20121206/26747_1 /TAXON_ID=160619 /ORGANISM="Kryptoperidinium foliaceum, Strain CCMP 1326" /LENGTH=413 /DNA_ID=CAMNT_0017387227 /DNA_START=72 /DNA_END=1313 /DNA_ORIENTATION=+